MGDYFWYSENASGMHTLSIGEVPHKPDSNQQDNGTFIPPCAFMPKFGHEQTHLPHNIKTTSGLHEHASGARLPKSMC